MRLAFALNRVLIALLILAPSLRAQEDDPTPSAEKPAPRAAEKARPKARREPIDPHRDREPKSHMGRAIAPVMSYLGADWLVRPEREVEERPEEMIDALKIRPGDTVADVGAGVGYTSLRLARRVGPRGRVFATDIQPEMIRRLKANLRAARVANVQPVLCTATDPKLPEGAVDLILMVDVYHECSDPVATLKGLRQALKPDGRLVLVEFRAEDPEVPIKAEHKMSVEQVLKELEPQGFALKERLEFLPWQHILIFGKAADAPKAAPTPAGGPGRGGKAEPGGGPPER